MENNMISDKEIEQVSKSLDIEFYRYKRYQTPVAVIIFDTECEHLYDKMKLNIRKTDTYERISDTKLVLILAHTEKDGALALIRKYMDEVKNSCNGNTMNVGYTHIRPDDELIENVITRIATSLKLAKKDFTEDIIYI